MEFCAAFLPNGYRGGLLSGGLAVAPEGPGAKHKQTQKQRNNTTQKQHSKQFITLEQKQATRSG